MQEQKQQLKPKVSPVKQRGLRGQQLLPLWPQLSAAPFVRPTKLGRRGRTEAHPPQHRAASEAVGRQREAAAEMVTGPSARRPKSAQSQKPGSKALDFSAWQQLCSAFPGRSRSLCCAKGHWFNQRDVKGPFSASKFDAYHPFGKTVGKGVRAARQW